MFYSSASILFRQVTAKSAHVTSRRIVIQNKCFDFYFSRPTCSPIVRVFSSKREDGGDGKKKNVVANISGGPIKTHPPSLSVKSSNNDPTEEDEEIDMVEDDEKETVKLDRDVKRYIPDQENLIKLKEKLSSIKEIDGYVLQSKRPRKDISLERNFITPIRAMTDFLLTNQELIGLRKTMRRSPHADEPPITVYWRKDVEAKAQEVWGTLIEMHSEKLKRDNESAEYREAVFNIKRILKKYREYSRVEHTPPSQPNPVTNLLTGSGRIVLTAVCINGCNFIIKLFAWWYTGSHSLFAESIHSLADTINQMILAFGIHKSTQSANVEHPYGYANMRHVASLISGVGIFCVGAGLSFYHGIIGLVALEHITSLYWAFYILGGSLVSESATLFMALSAVRKRAKESKITVKEFILRGQDPSLNVVILEDTAAVAGVGVASLCMGLTAYYNSPVYDAVGSLVIGGILGSVASFIIYSNSAALVGRSIPKQNLNRINTALESDVMIRAIHDVKGIDMGNTMVRYKAEVDFDGRELTRAYMEKQDIPKLLEEVKAMKSPEEFENFLFRHGENIVDTLGAEIDRIEVKLKKEHPEIRHCDLEIL